MQIQQRIIVILLVFCLHHAVQAQRVSVLSYNIHIAQDAQNKDQLKPMAEWIKTAGAGLIGLQEVDSVCNRSGKVDQLAQLKQITGMHGIFSRHFAFDGGAYGLAVLSRYPIDSVHHDRISLQSMGKQATRALLVVFVTVNKQPLAFATVHLDYRDAASRQQQTKEIVQQFSSYTMPVILTGDMNAEPKSAAIDVLNSVFQDCTQDQAFTYPVEKPTKKIDYVFVQKHAVKKIHLATVLPQIFSDHLPVMATIRLK